MLNIDVLIVNLIYFLAAKKVFNVLNLLHNYCVFVRHVHASTIGDLKVKLQLRDDLRTTKHKLQTEIEEAKIKEKNNLIDIKELDKRIPKEKARIAHLKTKESGVKAEIKKIQEENDKTDMSLLELQNELSNVKFLQVSKQEIDSIIKSKESIEKQVEEQEQITAARRQQLKENAHEIEEVRAVTEKMDAVYSKFNLDVEDLKNKKKQIEALKVEINALKANIAKNKTDIELMKQGVELKTTNVVHLTMKLDDIKKSYSMKEAQYKKELKQKNNLLRKLTKQQLALSETRDRLTENQQVLFQVASNAIKHISRPMFNDTIKD